MRIDIVRVEKSVDGMFGVLLIEKRAFCNTFEDIWDNNAYGTGIPNGNYTATKYYSPSKKIEVWQLNDVPDRNNIQIHAGNTLNDTLGCILIGQSWDKLRGNRAILNSGDTFTKFMQVTRNEKRLDINIFDVVKLIETEKTNVNAL